MDEIARLSTKLACRSYTSMKNFIVNQLTKVFSAILDQQRVTASLSRIIRENIQSELKNPDNQRLIWRAANVRPIERDYHWASIPNSIREQRMLTATRQAGEFVYQNMSHLLGKPDAYETLKAGLDAVTILDGLYAEFGVYSGVTINFLANEIGNQKVIHGFDSFEGLPENWGEAPKGTFNKHGEMPTVEENVILHKGWFEQTIDVFVKENAGPMAFIHADADLYSSTQTILSKLRDRIVKGTVIVFDEYINHPDWKDHEHKAFMEFIDETSLNFEYIAYTDRGYSVAVKII